MILRVKQISHQQKTPNYKSNETTTVNEIKKALARQKNVKAPG
jgi:hypothetical protein